jgi:hypothetical protein
VAVVRKRKRLQRERLRALWVSYRRLRAERDELIQQGVSPHLLDELRRPR